MADIFRDAPAGHFVRFFTGESGKFLTYADERAGFDRVPGAAGSSTSSTPEQKELSDGDAEKQSADLTSRKPDDIVDWYDAHDPDNPQNWSQAKKTFVFTQIVLLTFSGKLIHK